MVEPLAPGITLTVPGPCCETYFPSKLARTGSGWSSSRVLEQTVEKEEGGGSESHMDKPEIPWRREVSLGPVWR